MRIAQVAPIIERVPPKKYGGTERMVYELTEELVKMGHHVTLFASGDSQTSAKLHSVYPRSLREAKIRDLYGLNEWPLYNIGEAYSHQSEFDVIHDHNGYISLPTAHLSRTPSVLTLHGPLTVNQRRMFEALSNPYIVSISNSQIRYRESINYIGNVYHGLNFEQYPFSKTHDGYLLFVGRMSEEKGVHHAIEVAQMLDMPLIIAAKLDQIDKEFFNRSVEPLLSDERVKWVGEVDEKKRNELMSRALCMLHPVSFREPFGLTLIEAMACGCPVVAFNRGSIPEIIEHGKTGYVVEDIYEMADAVSLISRIDRRACYEHARTKFSSRRMARDYEAIYRAILHKSRRLGMNGYKQKYLDEQYQ